MTSSQRSLTGLPQLAAVTARGALRRLPHGGREGPA